MDRRITVSIIGDSVCDEGTDKWNIAFECGKALVDNGFRVLTGGAGGVMNAVMAGAHTSKKYREGDTIAVLPMYDPNKASPYADIVISTGIDFARNVIVANSRIVVAIGGGSGTLNEITAAWSFCRMVLALRGVKGWSAKVADTRLDNRHTYGGTDSIIHGFDNAEQLIEVIKEKFHIYNKTLTRIEYGKRVVEDILPSNWAGPVSYKKSTKK